MSPTRAARPAPRATVTVPVTVPGDPTLSRDHVALFAGRLLSHACAAFQVVPEPARVPLHAAIDVFTIAPGPSTYLSAFRTLDQARRRALIERVGSGILRRAVADGLTALRGVASVPAAAVDVLAAHLSIDARAGVRLHALAALAGAYHELSARVAADGDRRRLLWKSFPRRRPRPG